MGMFNITIFYIVIIKVCAISLLLEKSIENEIHIPSKLSVALKDVAVGMNCKVLTIYSEMHRNYSYMKLRKLSKYLQNGGVPTILFENVDNKMDVKEKYFQHLSVSLTDVYEYEVTSIIFCKPIRCEDLLAEIRQKNLIHRFLVYIFYWGAREASNRFLAALHEAMRVAVITNPRPDVFRLYYNQARRKEGEHLLPLVNWWSKGKLYNTPTLPPSRDVYSDMEGRVFRVPVLHAPPWYFVVKLSNDSSIKVTGGRDHHLLNLLANKLNFRYQYFDPPQHGQGAGVTKNGSFKGVLGLIYRREADFFLGDVTISWERQRAVEFSFLTLVDSGAFMTRARRRLSEALALTRPFRWQVWPAILITVAVGGPALWMVAVGSAFWEPRGYQRRPSMGQCSWFVMAVFLKQSDHVPSQNRRVRAVALLLSFAATYVLSDVYSAMLTSLLARPTLEPPLATLPALEEAMLKRGYNLLVEKYSSSLAILQNGTGVFGRLWKLMEHQNLRTVHSVEQGTRLLLHHNSPIAVLAGRETLYFNTKRFGTTNFQLSEKLYTRYSAIALQIGCPYVENFNKVLMSLFEAGILAKMTSEEYEKLGADSATESNSNAFDNVKNGEDRGVSGGSTNANMQKLEAINMHMLQGAFYILFLGYVISVITLMLEIKKSRKSKENNSTISHKCYLNIFITLKKRLIGIGKQDEMPSQPFDYAE